MHLLYKIGVAVSSLTQYQNVNVLSYNLRDSLGQKKNMHVTTVVNPSLEAAGISRWDNNLSNADKIQVLINAEKNFINPSDGRIFSSHGDVGSDRMSSHHYYASVYADNLSKLNTVHGIAEVGILGGSGLGLWSLLYDKVSIFGFDYKPETFQNNAQFLVSRGMDESRVKVSNFDALAADQDTQKNAIKTALNGQRISIGIDDGPHQPQSWVNIFAALIPHMDDSFVYFIEDLTSPDESEYKEEIAKLQNLCTNCKIKIECPDFSDKPDARQECIMMITRV